MGPRDGWAMSLPDVRVGQGFDVHRFEVEPTSSRRLVLGGCVFEGEPALIGHSDADVLIHAIIDALLGALALGDIGMHFPDTSDEYRDIDSKILLERSYKMILDKGFRIVNLDATLMLERPKMKEYIPEMRSLISRLLQTERENISIKATTTEKLGFTGREEGVAADAIVLLEDMREN